MANKLNFTGWSGNTFDVSNLNFSERAQTPTQQSSKIITGPVVINRDITKDSKITPGVKQTPVATVKSEPNPDFTKATKLGAPSTLSAKLNLESTTLPFTAGTIDTTFPYGPDNGFNNSVFATKIQPDGKILVGGSFDYYEYNGNSYYAPYFIRLNSDGSPDFNFYYTFNADDNGWNLNGNVKTIDIQSDGKILIGGEFEYYYEDSTWYSPRIMRFNSDGTFDDTLFVGDGFNGNVNKILIQPNGKILVGGDFWSYNNNNNWRIIRLNSNGTSDSSFNTGDGINWDDYGGVYDIVLQSDGKIILGGDFYNYNGNNVDYIVRINSNGSYDNTFVIGDGFNDTVYSLGLQSDGKIIVGGNFDYYNNIDLYNGRIVRLGVNGEMDTRFGYGLDNNVLSLYVQSDDKILVGGCMGVFYIDNNNSVSIDELVRFQSDCTLDFSFYYDNRLDSCVLSITLDSDNKIYIGGDFYEDGEPYLLNHFGRINNSILEYAYVYTIEACTQPLIGETVTYVVGSTTPLNSDVTYSLQSLQNPSITVCGFIVDTYPSNVIEYAAVNVYNNCEEAYKSNYKPVVLQDVLLGENNTTTWVVDNQFNDGDILFVDTVVDLEGTTYVKFAATILSGTTWGEVFGSVWNYLPPVNYVTYTSGDEAIEANGVIYEVGSCLTPETTYPLIYTPYYGVKTILIPTENNPVKVIQNYFPFGNYEWISNGTPEVFSSIEIADGENCPLGLSKLSPNGILDQIFENTGFDGSLVYTTVEQPDGKILVGGNFDQYLETNVGNLMRINPDGSLDETFYLGQFNDYVRAITLQPDGKILVGGDFTDYGGYSVGRFIRLNSDGTNDENFTFSTEFNDTVRAIAVQRDGKIVVGGDFNYYYDFYCPQIVRLNSDGTPDPTFVMGDGFDGDQVFTINIESYENIPYYFNGGARTYTENIVVGGWFTWYNGTTVRGIVKLSPTGEVLPDFGEGFNINEGDNPRVNQILTQPDGKLIVIGGGNSGGYLLDYNETWIPQNIVRLVKVNNRYEIDTTFTTRDWDSNGGFSDSVLTVTLLPNGKYMVGGQFDNYGDNSNIHNNLPYLVRLNSNGKLDETFTFDLDDDYVNKTLLLSSGELLVGGRFNNPYDLLLKLYIGEEYVLRSFNTCDGKTSNIFLPTDFPVVASTNSGEFSATPITYELISTDGLDLVYDGDNDDDNFVITMPTPFDINFLGVNYSSINVSTNPYITFGEGGSPSDCCFDIPNEIPSNTELPGVYLSFQCGPPHEPGDYDADMLQLYTGLTDGGNTLIIKYFGQDHCNDIIPLNYTFRFFKDNSDYFDLLIDDNTLFFNDDPTGGISNGVDETWLATFDSTGGNAYRIGYSSISGEPIKANVNNNVVVCGTVGDIITTPNLKEGSSINGSMYFNGTDSLVTIDYNGQMDLNFGPWTVEWYQKYTSTDTCCRRVFDIGQIDLGGEEFGVSLESNDTMLLWLAQSPTVINLNTSVYNVWSYFAITSENIGGSDQIIRVYQDGVLIYSGTTTVDLNNFQGDPTVQLPLVIGGGRSDNNSLFEGYITNFRWSKGSLYYDGPTMEVPTIPLAPYNASLLFTTVDEAGLLTNDCVSGGFIPANEISANNVTWSTETPFVNLYNFSLFTATNSTTYNSCDDCGQMYKTLLYVRDGVNPNKVVTSSMSLSTINNVLTNGPIFTTRGPECYEILKYTY